MATLERDPTTHRGRWVVLGVLALVAPGPDPLVLLTRRAAASPMWADNLPTLRVGRTVYLVDLLGEPGASVQDRPIENAADQARWLDETLAALPHPRLYVLGASIGGWTAMNLAVRGSAKLAGVVLLDPVLTFSSMAPEAVVRSIPASVRWLPRSWRDAFTSWTAGGAPVAQVPVAEMIEAGMQTYRIATPGPARFTDDELRRVRVPVLAIMAGRSVMHDPVAAADTARRLLPDARVLIYPDATHAINGEFPDRIAHDVGAALAGRPR